MINKFKKLIKKEIKSKSDEDLNKEIYNLLHNAISIFNQKNSKNVNMSVCKNPIFIY